MQQHWLGHDVQIGQTVEAELAYPVLSSSCLASLSLQANSSRNAASCWVLKDFFCFLCSSRYDSSVNIGFMYFCTAGGGGHRIKQGLWHSWEWGLQRKNSKVEFRIQICPNLQGNVSAPVPHALQKADLPVAEVQQLRPHTVVDVKEVVGVRAGVLHHLLWQGATRPSESSVLQIFQSWRQNNNEQKASKLPDPPVGELVAFIRGHVAEVCEQMIERVSGQIQSPAGLVCVKKSDYVQAKVPLEPLDVRVSTVKYLRVE